MAIVTERLRSKIDLHTNSFQKSLPVRASYYPGCGKPAFCCTRVSPRRFARKQVPAFTSNEESVRRGLRASIYGKKCSFFSTNLLFQDLNFFLVASDGPSIPSYLLFFNPPQYFFQRSNFQFYQIFSPKIRIFKLGTTGRNRAIRDLRLRVRPSHFDQF